MAIVVVLQTAFMWIWLLNYDLWQPGSMPDCDRATEATSSYLTPQRLETRSASSGCNNVEITWHFKRSHVTVAQSN